MFWFCRIGPESNDRKLTAEENIVAEKTARENMPEKIWDIWARKCMRLCVCKYLEMLMGERSRSNSVNL